MKSKILYFFPFFIFFASQSYAASISAQQQAGIQAGTTLEDKEIKLRNTLKNERVSPGVEETRQKEIEQLPASEKAMITKIEVTGIKLLSLRKIKAITFPYENRVLTIREIQDVTNRITDAYRQEGYITSRAFLPPQKIENGILKIEVAEGMMGKVNVQGNKFYCTSLFNRRIELKEGRPFNYTTLRQNLGIINQYPDHKVTTVLTPGQVPGTTDVLLNVKDQLPIHAGLAYDNYGSRYLRKNRYTGTLTDNNLLGFDDMLTLTYQRAEGHGTYYLDSLRYLFPLTNKTQIGFYAGHSQLRLGKEFKDLDARGKSRFYSLFLTQDLFSDDTTDLSASIGFDYKDVFNFQNGNETSRDRERVAHAGLKLDKSDSLGRTIVNNEVDDGIPNTWGALKAKDSRSSVTGSGGQFTKDVLDVVRLQKLPLDSALLLKGQAQFAARTLTATEQFQIGGISNVRAYPIGEVVGDNGQSCTAELSFPIYGIPKNIQAAPHSKGKLYDDLKLAVFYDWANASLRNPDGAKKNKSLSGAGWGLRYDLPENFSIRFDMAWALDNTPSDGKNVHSWIRVSKDF
ncbi:MAG: ShlB/FhaC/HecB family hemolysin secretion/activation protein [Candidatus Omnitrophica bacterium]|nr:ShlB/FhaC/HecB family hemolysin secretion/activation protein [Candidatus Omnitrophota bacterium]